MIRPPFDNPSLHLGEVLPDGRVVLDHAEAEYVRQLLASIRVAEVTGHVTAKAWADGRFVGSFHQDQLRALGQIGEPCAYRGTTAPDYVAMNREAQQDMHTVRTRLAFVSGGVPPWPKDRQNRGEAALADAWTSHLRRNPVPPPSTPYAFTLGPEQLRPADMAPVKSTDDRAVLK